MEVTITPEEVKALNEKRYAEKKKILEELESFRQKVDEVFGNFCFTSDMYEGPVEEIKEWADRISGIASEICDEVEEAISNKECEDVSVQAEVY